MLIWPWIGRRFPYVAMIIAPLLLASCGSNPPPPQEFPQTHSAMTIPDYRINPLDVVQIHVAGAPELSVTVPVRPDGKLSIPLVEDLPAAGITPSELAREIEQRLRPYVQQPAVSVVLQQFADSSAYTVRVLGAVARPVAVPFRPRMTVLDVMVAAGGLSEFAAGNRATLIRAGDEQQAYRLRLQDLLTDADRSANAPVLPGDVIIVPESLL